MNTEKDRELIRKKNSCVDSKVVEEFRILRENLVRLGVYKPTSYTSGPPLGGRLDIPVQYRSKN